MFVLDLLNVKWQKSKHCTHEDINSLINHTLHTCQCHYINTYQKRKQIHLTMLKILPLINTMKALNKILTTSIILEDNIFVNVWRFIINILIYNKYKRYSI